MPLGFRLDCEAYLAAPDSDTFCVAADFLEVLAPHESVFDFRTLDDNKARKATGLTRRLRGSLERHWPEMQRVNERGAGVFVTINESDGRGVKAANIVRVRAVWHEDDQGLCLTFPLPPSLVVKSSTGKFHHYWLVDDMTPEQFKSVMRCMVEVYRSDKGVTDIGRILRLPGTLHMKGEPQLVEIIENNGARYSGEEVAAAFPAPVSDSTQALVNTTENGKNSSFTTLPSDRAADIESALFAIPADDRETWIKIGMALKSEFGEAGRELWEAWSRTSDKFNQRDQDAKWRGFRRSGVNGNSIFFEAGKWGWRSERSEADEAELLEMQRRILRKYEGGAEAPQEDSEFICVAGLTKTAPPPRRWLVEGLVPLPEVTLLAGDGGIGKSTLALQLAMACASGGTWIGKPVMQCRVLYLSAEDNRDEFHWRVNKMQRRFGPIPEGSFYLLDTAGEDSALGTYDREGRLRATKLLERIEAAVDRLGLQAIILDSLADVFGGRNENDRSEANQFINRLRKLALKRDCAVLILAHPSAEGLRSKSGTAGSTQWNNKVRSRLYFRIAECGDGGLIHDGDARLLEVKKGNRGKPGEIFGLLWDDHFFIEQADLSAFLAGVESGGKSADEVFLNTLDKWGRFAMGHVSSNVAARNYAPRIFFEKGESGGYGVKALEVAMRSLMERGKIVTQGYGPPSKGNTEIVINSTAS